MHQPSATLRRPRSQAVWPTLASFRIPQDDTPAKTRCRSLNNPAQAPSRHAALRLPLVAAGLTLVRVGGVAALSPPHEYYTLFEIGAANVIWVPIATRLWQRDG
jgi:hypothetical protein